MRSRFDGRSKRLITLTETHQRCLRMGAHGDVPRAAHSTQAPLDTRPIRSPRHKGRESCGTTSIFRRRMWPSVLGQKADSVLQIGSPHPF